ncbi:MAG: hypothetical protein QOD07_326 [Frankiaceae bacterium]|nr:hypothetical protein [Frankiaceae bacterium]
MPRSLEARRLAVVEALRAVAAEPLPVPRPEPSVIDAVGAVGARLDDLSGRLDEVLARLGSVETALLESAWEQPCPERATEETEPESTVSVPAVDGLAEGRMSSVAAKALFGH